jgi:hypothetical protein
MGMERGKINWLALPSALFVLARHLDAPPGLLIAGVVVVLLVVAIHTRKSWVPWFSNWGGPGMKLGIASILLILGAGLLVHDLAGNYRSHEGAALGAMLSMGGFLLWTRNS